MKKNIIYNEDCLIGMDKIPDKSIDMILCDLPYGTTRCKWDVIIPLDKLWKQYERIIKDNGAIVLFAQTPFDKILGCSNLKLLRYEWIWEKTSATGFLNANKMPLKAHENILVFYKTLPTFNPQKTTGHKPVNSNTRYIKTQNKTELYGKMSKEISGGGNTDRFPRSVQKFPSKIKRISLHSTSNVLTFSSDKQKSKLHPTQKPLDLLKYLIKTYSNEGDLILDNCGGSGSTFVSCIQTNRNYIGFELEEKYYNISIKRIKDLEN